MNESEKINAWLPGGPGFAKNVVYHPQAIHHVSNTGKTGSEPDQNGKRNQDSGNKRDQQHERQHELDPLVIGDLGKHQEGDQAAVGGVDQVGQAVAELEGQHGDLTAQAHQVADGQEWPGPDQSWRASGS